MQGSDCVHSHIRNDKKSLIIGLECLGSYLFFVLITKYNGETKCQNIDLIHAVLIFFCPILCPLILVDEIVF